MLTSTTRKGAILSLICLGLAISANASRAATISFNYEIADGGTGFGNVLSIMGLQDKDKHTDPGYTYEFGSITWNGVNDVRGGEATNNNASHTRTVAEMLDKGINASNLGLIFNINEPGVADSVDLREFSLIFQDSSGATLPINATFTASPSPLNLSIAGQGTGSSGYLFRVHFVGNEGVSFFSDPTNRIGMIVPQDAQIGQAAGGDENYYLAAAPAIVPLPSSAWAGASLMGALGMVRICRRRND